MKAESMLALWNEKILSDPPATPRDFLLSRPRGAYTVIRTVHYTRLVHFDFHITRLVSSLEFLGMLSPSAVESVRPALRSRLLAAIQSGLNAMAERGHIDKEFLITSLVTPCTAEESGFDLGIHITPLITMPHATAVKVEAFGPPRTLPLAKDSQWLRDRQPLESRKSQGTIEVVLLDNNGRLLEGLISNLFIITAAGVVHTAGDGVLPGHMADLVLRVCARANIPVRLEAPGPDTQDTWREAFLTSTTRMALPVSEISFPTDPKRPAASFTYTSDSLVFVIQRLLQDEFEAVSTPLNC